MSSHLLVPKPSQVERSVGETQLQRAALQPAGEARRGRPRAQGGGAVGRTEVQGAETKVGEGAIGRHLKDVLLLQHRAHFQGRAVLHVLDGLDQLPVEFGEEDLMAAELLECGSPVPEQRLQAEGRARMGGGAARGARSLPEPGDHFPPAARTPPCGLDW